MLRPLRITCEVIASLVGVVVLLGLFLVWRLSQGPLQSSFLTPYLEHGIQSLAPETKATIEHTVLSWNDVDHSIALHADNLQVVDHDGDVIASVPALDIQLSAIGMVFGQFLPTAFTVIHPQMHLQRRYDGSFAFGSTAASIPPDLSKKSDDDDTLKGDVSRIANHLLHAFFTHKLQVSRAVFDIHDIATKSDWSVSIPDIGVDRSGRELTGQAAIDVTQKDKTSTIEVHYAYDRVNKLHRLVTRFSDITPSFFAGGHPATLGLGQATMVNFPLTGEITLALDDDINVIAGTLQLHGDAGTLINPSLWEIPRAVKNLDIQADYDEKKGTINVPSATIDFGGPKLAVQASAKPPVVSIHTIMPKDLPRKLDLDFAVQLDNWPMDQYAQLWPKSIIPDVRDWLAANISKGVYDHGEVALRGTIDLSHPDDIDLKEGKGKVTASNARVQYLEGMPPVDGVNASALFDLNHLTAQISGGGIGDIRVVPFAITITGFEDNMQNIVIPLKVTGPIPSVLKLIDQPPLGYAKAVGITPNDVTGQANAEVTFRFPLMKTLKMDDLGIIASANLSQVASSKLVPSVNITQGNLTLDLNTDGFGIKGPATLNGVPMQVTWQEYFKESSDKPLKQATLTGNVGAEQWQALGIDMFNGTRGLMAVTFQMTQPTKEKQLFSGTLDMTNAEIHIDQLNWKKAPQIPAIGNFAAQKKGDKIEVSTFDVHGPQMNVKGRATFSDDDLQLISLNLNPLIAGRTNASVHFSRIDDDKNGALHFDASGEALDASGFQGGKEPEHSKPQPKEFHIKVGKLYTSANGFISKAEGYAIRDPQGWSEISLHGLADGTHQLGVELDAKPDGSRTFAITCDDFGKMLKGLGFTDTVRGGNVDIYGESDPENPRIIDGRLIIGAFNIGNLPMLAVLMNAASPFGFSGLFSDSMDFSRVNGKFRWEGDTVKFTGVHAAGASVGLNIGGKIDMDNNVANLRGTMVPFSVVNGIIGSIPLIGDLFTGGKDQGLFAVSYKITGPVDKPNVTINPISLLTPGIIRNIFFDDGNDDDDDDQAPENK